MRPARRLAFRLVAVVAAVLLTIGALEGGLRLTGFGVPTSVLIRGHEQDEPRLLSNPRFTWPYFGPERARDFTPFSLAATKPDGVYRIFVLGGSAAQGDPRPVFGMDRMLEVMLHHRYPGRRFEVVNASITAVNSHVMLRVAQACAGLEPDLFVVYMGNNEVVGPYGAGSAFSSVPRYRWTVGLDLAWKRSRLGQFVESMQRRRAAKGRDRTWRGMQLFLDYQVAAGDPELQTVYRHFEANLHDIIDVAHRAGAGVILSTVGVNLRDCAPFASLHREDLQPAQRDQWEVAFARGKALEEAGKPEDALTAYGQAAEVDGGYAELAYRMARCRLALGDAESARAQYRRARDLDTLRFRADTRINDILREVGEDRDDVRPVDAEALLAAQSADGLPGADLFFEHVHLRFAGNYLVARAVLDEVSGCLPDLAGDGAALPDPLSREEVAAGLAFTGWDAEGVVSEVLERLAVPPFTAQIDNHGQREVLLREHAVLVDRLAAGGLAAAAEAIAGATAAQDAHLLLRRRHAAFLLSQGTAAEEAVRQLERVLDRCPQSSTDWIMHGRALGLLGRHEEALESYRRALALNPFSAGFLSNLGVGRQQAGHMAKAREAFEQALEMDPFEEMAHFNLAVLLLSGKRVSPVDVAKAEAHYRTALEINPAYHEARHNLSRLYYRQAQAAVQAGATQRGVELLEQTLATDPSYAFPHYNLGVLNLRDLGDQKNAALHFRAFLDAAGDEHPKERDAAEQVLAGVGGG